jgi:outer membrane receptor protein involved in Fe transport
VTVDEQKALFGEVSFDVATHLKANVGVRVERSTVEQQRETTAGPLQGTAYSSIVLPDQSQTPITPRFGLTYQYTDSDMVYVSAAKGYRAGGSNSPNVTANSLCEPSAQALGLSTVPASYNSDSLWSYEIGTKDTFLDQRLSLQTSIYYIDWSNIQTSVYLQSCGNTYEANRGRAISQGFDLQFAAILAEGLKVSGTLGYTDAYYPNAAYGAPVGGTEPLLNGAGDKLANVLPWTASAHMEYSHATDGLIAGSRSYIRLDYRWLDGGPKANPNVAGYDPAIGPYPDEAYRILNLRIGTVFYGIDLSAFLNNATNSNPLLSYSHLLAGDPLFTATAIRPRTAGITALLKF